MESVLMHPPEEVEPRSQFLLRLMNDDGALVSYKLRKTVKRSLSVLASRREAPSWLMSLQRAASARRDSK